MDFIFGIIFVVILILILINYSSISISDTKGMNNTCNNPNQMSNYLVSGNPLQSNTSNIVSSQQSTPIAKSNYDYHNYFFVA